MNPDFEASYYALRKIYSEAAYSNIEINEATEKYEKCSPGFVRYVVKGVLRNTFLLDYKIERLARNGLRGMKAKTKVLLRIGIYILDEMDDIPDAVCVHETVELAKRVNRPNSSFINAVLRSYLRKDRDIAVPDGSSTQALSIRYSCDPKLIRLILRQYGQEEGIRMLRAFNEPVDVSLRCNPMVQSRQVLLEKLSQNGMEVEPAEETENGIYLKKGKIVNSEYFLNGACSIQGISSQIAIEALDPKEGEIVLDLCAAPGGKSAAAAERMNDTGILDAWDVHEHRVELIRKNAERLHLSIISPSVHDSTVYDPSLGNRYDAVIADVPCSGLGTISSKPEIKLRTDTSYGSLIEVQRRILENAWKYAKPGGRVMYSTCTINRDENDGVIREFLTANPAAVVVEKKQLLPYNKNGFFFCIIRK